MKKHKFTDYYLVVNLDERGDYSASVYDPNDKSVFEIESAEQVKEMQDDGYLKGKPDEDLDLLTKYLMDTDMIPNGSQVYSKDVFEDKIREQYEEEKLSAGGGVSKYTEGLMDEYAKTEALSFKNFIDEKKSGVSAEEKIKMDKAVEDYYLNHFLKEKGGSATSPERSFKIGDKFKMGDEVVYIGEGFGVAGYEDEIHLFYKKDDSIVKAISKKSFNKFIDEGKLTPLKSSVGSMATGGKILTKEEYEGHQKSGKKYYKNGYYKYTFSDGRKDVVQIVDDQISFMADKRYSSVDIVDWELHGFLKKRYRDNYDLYKGNVGEMILEIIGGEKAFKKNEAKEYENGYYEYVRGGRRTLVKIYYNVVIGFDSIIPYSSKSKTPYVFNIYYYWDDWDGYHQRSEDEIKDIQSHIGGMIFEIPESEIKEYKPDVEELNYARWYKEEQAKPKVRRSSGGDPLGTYLVADSLGLLNKGGITKSINNMNKFWNYFSNDGALITGDGYFGSGNKMGAGGTAGNKLLEFKWGRTNAVSLYVNDSRVATAGGGGYDKKGTVLGEWIQKEFQEELKKLYAGKKKESDYYGMSKSESGDKIFLDGATGFNSMENILNAIGYGLDRVASSKNVDKYILVESKAQGGYVNTTVKGDILLNIIPDLRQELIIDNNGEKVVSKDEMKEYVEKGKNEMFYVFRTPDRFFVSKKMKKGGVVDEENKTEEDYEEYLNELGDIYDYEADQWIIGGKHRWDEFNGQYGSALKKHDPIAFQVGFREWNP
jgi:hypothetical protein